MTSFPTDAVEGLIALITKGQFLGSLPQAGQYLCAIISWALGLGLKTACGFTSADEDLVASLPDRAVLINLLAALHMANDSIDRHRSVCDRYLVGDAGTAGFDPTIIISLIQTLGPMLLALLQKIHDLRHPTA
jgi:hypothetical protein